MKSGGSGEKNFEIERILHLKSDCVVAVQFYISDFGFEMQDSSNFKFSYQPLDAITGQRLRRVGPSIP